MGKAEVGQWGLGWCQAKVGSTVGIMCYGRMALGLLGRVGWGWGLIVWSWVLRGLVRGCSGKVEQRRIGRGGGAVVDPGWHLRG